MIKNRYKLSLLVALATAQMSTSVNAETDYLLDDLVVTGTRSGASLLEQAGNTTRVSEHDIDLVRADHVTEVVNRMPGVMVQRGNGQEHLTSIRSPVLQGGAGAGSFLYLEDGIPLRAAGFANVNSLFEVNHEQAGGIEVVRGPGSALYGSNAVHGLMNFLSRAPSLDLEREIDLSAGPHDLYRGKFTVSDTVGAHGYRFSINGTTDNGYARKAGYDQQKLTFRHDYTGDRDSFTTLFSANNLNQKTQGYLTEADTGLKRSYRQGRLARSNPNLDRGIDAYRDAKSARLSVRWDREVSDQATFSLTPYIRYTEMDFLMHFLPGQPVEKNKHRSVGLLAAYDLDLDGGHRIIFGTDFEYTRGELSEVQFNPAAGFGMNQSLPGVHYDYEVDATVIAPYVHSEWQVAERTRVTAGLRYEYTRYDYENNADGELLPGTLRYFRPDDRVDTFHNVSPKLGVVQMLTEDSSVFVNLARGNRAPQTTDLYRLQAGTTGGRASSEKMDSIEIGYRSLGTGLQYELTTYYMRKKNYFFRDADNNNVTDGKTEHYGVELGLFYPITQQWDISSSLTYGRHRFRFDNEANGIEKGADMSSAPKRMANIRLGWNFLPDSRAELEWSHIGKYYLEETNERSYSGHDLFNLRAYHTVNPSLTLHAKVHNLFDTRYAERADWTQFNGYRYFVGERRGLHVGMTYKF